MMSKAQDIQNESVVALRGWLDYLEEQDGELRSQLERLRRKEKPVAPDEDGDADVSDEDDNPENWM